jgi:hypothetical protein
MAKDPTIFRIKNPLSATHKVFVKMQKEARRERREERRKLYQRVSKFVGERVVFGQAFGDLGDGKGFPMIARVEMSKPGQLKIFLYLDKTGTGATLSRSQGEIFKERSLWFKVVKDDDSNLRRLLLENDAKKKWEVKESNHFQTLTFKTKIIPDQKELDRLLDLDPMKFSYV